MDKFDISFYGMMILSMTILISILTFIGWVIIKFMQFYKVI